MHAFLQETSSRFEALKQHAQCTYYNNRLEVVIPERTSHAINSWKHAFAAGITEGGRRWLARTQPAGRAAPAGSCSIGCCSGGRFRAGAIVDLFVLARFAEPYRSLGSEARCSRRVSWRVSADR